MWSGRWELNPQCAGSKPAVFAVSPRPDEKSAPLCDCQKHQTKKPRRVRPGFEEGCCVSANHPRTHGRKAELLSNDCEYSCWERMTPVTVSWISSCQWSAATELHHVPWGKNPVHQLGMLAADMGPVTGNAPAPRAPQTRVLLLYNTGHTNGTTSGCCRQSTGFGVRSPPWWDVI